MFGGIDIITDSAVPTTLGTGTNEDRILVMRDLDAVDLFTTDPVVEMGDVVTSTLEVFISVRKYAAIVVDRQPARSAF